MAGSSRLPSSVRPMSKHQAWRLNMEGRLRLLASDEPDVEPVTMDDANVECRRLVDERYRELGRFPRAGETLP